MKKLLLLAAVVAAVYYGWQYLGGGHLIPKPQDSADTTPGANMKQRIDNRSGIAPE